MTCNISCRSLCCDLVLINAVSILTFGGQHGCNSACCELSYVEAYICGDFHLGPGMNEWGYMCVIQAIQDVHQGHLVSRQA